jgi:hypothetical protein
VSDSRTDDYRIDARPDPLELERPDVASTTTSAACAKPDHRSPAISTSSDQQESHGLLLACHPLTLHSAEAVEYLARSKALSGEAA